MWKLEIQLDDDNLKNFIEYEKELIKCVSYQNIIYFESDEWPYPDTMCLNCMGIKYINDESFDTIEHISEMISKGYGKCDSIVAWFLAVYEMLGIEAEPILVKRSEQELHAQLKVFENNKVKIIDPSVDLKKLCAEICEVCK